MLGGVTWQVNRELDNSLHSGEANPVLSEEWNPE
jgi:hypothetical protein